MRKPPRPNARRISSPAGRIGPRYQIRTRVIEVLIGFVILGIIFALLTAAFGVDGKSGNSNTNPRSGWVEVNEDLRKRCDGSTMLYHNTWSDDYNVAPNAPECAPR